MVGPDARHETDSPWRKGADMKLRVVPIALSLALSGGVPGLIAATAVPAAAATATATYTMTDLGSLGLGVSRGFGINAAGEVVGRSYLAQSFPTTGCPPTHTCVTHPAEPFSWTAGTMTDLGTLGVPLGKKTVCNPPDCFGEARAVNRNGDIVGLSDGQAFLVHNGKMSSLGPGTATGINDLGQVTGWAHTASEATHVFLWSGGKMRDLGTFGLDPVGEAINNHGVIVGQSGAGAWVWSGGVFQNLNNLIPPGSGFTLDNATAINANGQIVANGYNAQGQEHAFLLTPS